MTPGNNFVFGDSTSSDQFIGEQINASKFAAFKLHTGALNVDSGPCPSGPSGDLVVSTGGTKTVSIPTTAGATVVKAAPGRACKAVVTVVGTGSGTPCYIYDNATTNSGTIIGVVLANAALGLVVDIQMPAANGIVVMQVTNGPVFTLSYD